MRTFLAILCALLTVLPHRAVMALAASGTCAPVTTACGEKVCACCPKDSCPCLVEKQSERPVPPPAVPVRTADFQPVTAMPPLVVELPAAVFLTAPDAVRVSPVVPVLTRVAAVPLFVRHRAFLI